MKNLLVVDDDYKMRSLLHETLSDRGYNVDVSKNGKAALKALKSEKYDLVISDLQMPKLNGIELLEIVKKQYPDVGFIILTGFGTIPLAVESLQKGAADFVTKPFSIPQIESKIKRFFDFEGLKKENKNLRHKLLQREKFEKIVGTSKAIKDVLNKIIVVADKEVPVFIQGESGTGKELVSLAIHANSPRANEPFLKINCTAIPETLFDSILFGYEKGAFTGANGRHKGIFEDADRGTLLLDEITEISIAMQAKLLRVLQEGKIIRVGSTKEIPVDVRIIATSNMNIYQLIKERRFRSDLFYRLNVFPITIPPLRSRIRDINVLVEYFLKEFKEKYAYKEKRINNAIRRNLMQYEWPGNVRELKNLIERAILNSGEEVDLTYKHFSFDSYQSPSDIYCDPDGSLSTITEMEKELIYAALRKTYNHRARAAKILGITARTLRNKLRQYKANDPN